MSLAEPSPSPVTLEVSRRKYWAWRRRKKKKRKGTEESRSISYVICFPFSSYKTAMRERDSFFKQSNPITKPPSLPDWRFDVAKGSGFTGGCCCCWLGQSGKDAVPNWLAAGATLGPPLLAADMVETIVLEPPPPLEEVLPALAAVFTGLVPVVGQGDVLSWVKLVAPEI